MGEARQTTHGWRIRTKKSKRAGHKATFHTRLCWSSLGRVAHGVDCAPRRAAQKKYAAARVGRNCGVIGRRRTAEALLAQMCRRTNTRAANRSPHYTVHGRPTPG